MIKYDYELNDNTGWPKYFMDGPPFRFKIDNDIWVVEEILDTVCFPDKHTMLMFLTVNAELITKD